MEKSWILIVKRFLLCMVVGALCLTLGTAITAVLVLQEVISLSGAGLSLYVTLVVSAVVACLIANKRQMFSRLLNATIGVASVIVVLVVGWLVLAEAGEGNITVPILVILSGGLLFMLLKIGAVGGRKGDRKITKMVKLYKNVT